MIDRENAREHLGSLFRRRPVADLPALQRALGTESRTSIFRILSKIGYLTSYSHSGRFYTLQEIPRFDEYGLWSYRDVFFSKFRTLRNSVLHLVNESVAGQTYSELQTRLHLRVYNALHDLIEAKEIGLEDLEQFNLYVSIGQRRARAQIAQRRKLLRTQPVAIPMPDPAIVIEVLVVYIHHPHADPHSVAALVRRTGKVISVEQVKTVFVQYELGKKKRPRGVGSPEGRTHPGRDRNP
jgi:hypothetical protein